MTSNDEELSDFKTIYYFQVLESAVKIRFGLPWGREQNLSFKEQQMMTDAAEILFTFIVAFSVLTEN